MADGQFQSVATRELITGSSIIKRVGFDQSIETKTDGGGHTITGNNSKDMVFIIDGAMKLNCEGVRFPMVTTAEKEGLTEVEGIVVYDTTLNKLCVYTGSAWETITSS